jgi:hypothetical protein
MKTFWYSLFLSLLLATLAGPAAAQTNIAGTWQGKLEAAPGKTIAIRFVIKLAPGGGYSAVLTSPDDGAIKNVTARTVEFADNRLTLDVPALSGAYAGTLRNGVIEGEWSQEGAKLPLSLRPYETPTLTRVDIDALVGEWSGKLDAGGTELTIVLRFTPGGAGALNVALDVPEQSVKDWPGQNIALDDGQFSVEIPMPQAKVTGVLKGNTIDGHWSQLGNSLPLVLTRQTSAAANALKVTAQAAAPYLGLYWADPVDRPMIIVLDNDRLALEMPWRTVRELKRTPEENVWAYVVKSSNLVKFHRDGAGRVTKMELRQSTTETAPRFQPEKGLPSVDELFALRPDAQRAKKLGALGTIRLSGSIDRSSSKDKGSFEQLAAGEDQSRLNLNLGGVEIVYVISGNRVWMRQQPSSPMQELPEGLARATRLGGWLLASGDWRDDFKQVRVLKRVTLDGKPAWLVHAAPEKGRQRLAYLDPQNGLTLGYDEVYEIPGAGLVGTEVRFADYRDIEGVQVPFKTTVKYGEQRIGTWTYQVGKIESRVKVPGNPFTGDGPQK